MLKFLSVTLLFFISHTQWAIAQDTTWEAPYVGSSKDVLYLPDANAVYWRYGWTRKDAASQNGFVIKGQFPEARYFSFNVYDDASKSSVGSFTDYRIKADSDNSSTYTLHIVPQGSPVKGRNVLYFPKHLTQVSVILRHYIAKDNIFGNVPMPEIKRLSADNKTLTAGPASSPVPKISKEDIQKHLLPLLRKVVDNPQASLQKLQSSLGGSTLTLEQLICRQVVANAFNYNRKDSVLHAYNFDTGGTYPNLDNHYLTMPISKTPGDAVLVKFKAPRYAKAAADNASSDVRYFSISQGDDITHNYQSLADHELTVQPDGFVYLLIADDGAMVKDKAKSLGLNFMPWLVKDQMLLVYRNLVPAARFSQGVHVVPKFDKSKSEASQRGDKFIGDYAPVGKLITHDALLRMEKIPAF